MTERKISNDDEDKAVMCNVRWLLAKGCDVMLKQDRHGNINVFQMKPQKIDLTKNK